MTIDDALTEIRPNIEDQYIRLVKWIFKNMIEDCGETLDQVVNSWTHARNYNQYVKYVIDRVNNGIAVINDERLLQAAQKYSELAIEQWKTKINSKIGQLQNVEIVSYDGTGFFIKGQRNGKNIKIEQSMILKSSSKGTLFNQFPARIYVDGKFTSEKQYKEIFNQ